MSTDDRLADDLASLSIDRGQKRGVAPNERRLWPWLIVVAAALIGGGAYATRGRTSQLFPSEVDVGSLTLVSPQQAEVTLVATGYVYAQKKATVTSKIIGRIAKIYFKEGQDVKEGQLLAELDALDVFAQGAQLRADLLAAQARVDRAKADLAEADAHVVRAELLATKGAGTGADLDDAKLRRSTSKAQLTAAEAEARAVAARQAAISAAADATKVRAPFDATVVRKLAEVGEPLAPTQTGASTTGLAMLATLHDLEVQADVAEAQFSKVKPSTPAEIILDAFPDKRFRGEVFEIRPTVDRAKATVTVKVKFIDPSDGVLPDMSAKVSFLSKPIEIAALQQKPRLVAPRDAVVDRAGKKVVFVIDDGHARETPVTVGAELGAMIEITAGPASGTKVVRKPSAGLSDGALIKERSL